MRHFILIFAMGFFILVPSVLAYQSETHAFLTDMAVDFCNGSSATAKFPDSLRNYLIDGSIREDDPPRSLNHFYDPVFQRGLTYDTTIDPVNIGGDWESSKNWAEDSGGQNSLVYKVAPTIASILSMIERGKISDVSSDSDFTWQRAIDLYRAGKKEDAMFALGHIIHLIEDASVPAHTRNDPHVTGSPYESFASRFTPQNSNDDLDRRLNGKTPIILADLGSYFDGIAAYSNNNFYSQDTIGLQSGYILPESDVANTDVKNGRYYVIGYDGEGNQFPLFKKNSILGALFDMKGVTVTTDDELVKSSYWTLLSTKAVQYSAGVLDLFLKTVEASDNKTDKSNESDRTDRNIPEPVVFVDRSVVKLGGVIIESGENFTPGSQVVLMFDLPSGRTVSSVISTDTKGAFANFYRMPLDAVLGNYAYYAKDPVTGAMSSRVFYSVVSEIMEIDTSVITVSSTASSTAEKATTAKTTASSRQCNFDANGTALYTPVVLNEIAWMGGSEAYGLSAADEWIELRNVTGSSVDLSGWQVVSKKGSVQIILPVGAVISPWGFYLLERTDDSSVPNIAADSIYAGGLSNTDDGMEVFNANCVLVDRVLADSEWPAGDASLRRTMERKGDLSWYTSGSSNGTIFGTPRAPNGLAYVPQSQIVYVGGGGGQGNPPDDPPPDFLITEIMYDHVGSDEGHEWIEVKNASEENADLSEIKFSENGVAHNLNIVEGGYVIPPGGFAVFSNGSTTMLEDFPAFSGNLFSASFSLNNSSGTVAMKYRDTVFGSVGYSSNDGANGDGNSLQLIEGVWVWSRPTPGAENVLDQSLVPDDPVATIPTSTPPIVGTSTNQVVVSEVQVEGTNADDEFIELYNPGDSEVELDGWSLQYFGGASGSFSSSTVFTENFAPGSIIKPRSFFLVAKKLDDVSGDGYTGSKIPDMFYRSFSLSGGPRGGILLLVSSTTEISSFDNNLIVDELAYGDSEFFAGAASVPESGGSLERKAFRNGFCLSPLQGAEGEFNGNGCSLETSFEAFEIREVSDPQNLQSLPEPRPAPTLPVPLAGEDTIAKYDFDGMAIKFSWSPSRDAANSPSGIIYEIDSEEGASLSPLTVTTSTGFNYSLSKIGRGYDFSITAFDRDGMSSLAKNFRLDTPPPLSSSSIVFFQGTLSALSAGSHYSDNWYELGRGFSGILHSLFLRGFVDRPEFYASHIYLKEFEDEEYSIELASFTLSDDVPFTNIIHNVVLEDLDIELHPFSYYRLDTYQDYQNRSVILSGTTSTGAAMSNSFVTDVGKVFHYYSFSPFMIMEGEPGPEVDVSVPQQPTTPLLNPVNFDAGGNSINISWTTSTDLDSVDSEITYEYNVTTLNDFSSAEWKRAEFLTSVSYPVSFPNKYHIGVRAIDGGGLQSEISVADWEFPADFSSPEIELEVSSSGFIPPAFAVGAGSAVTLSLVVADDETHVFKFDDPSIQSSPGGAGPGMTRAITFDAPTSIGEYAFRCDVPGHAQRGEVGIMTVE